MISLIHIFNRKWCRRSLKIFSPLLPILHPCVALASDADVSALQNTFRKSIESCWNIDFANETSVTLRIHLDRNGKVNSPLSLYLIDSTGGSKRDVEDAFNSARRAVLRCQKGGFDLPMNDYKRWKTIEIMFDKSNIFR